MGKKSPPPAPDYTKAAEIQAQSSKDNTQAQTVANRPNIVTPWGSQTWSKSTPTTFNQQGYDAALAAYNAQEARRGQPQPMPGQQPPPPLLHQPEPDYGGGRRPGPGGGMGDREDRGDYMLSSPQSYGGQQAYSGQQSYGGQQSYLSAPTREQFTTTTGPEEWTQTTTLSPAEQASLDAQMRIGMGKSNAAEQLLGQATSAFQTPVDYSKLPQGATAVTAPGRSSALPQWGGSAMGIDPGGSVQGSFGSGGPVQGRLGGSYGAQTGFQGGGPVQGQLSGPSQGTMGSVQQGQLFGLGGSAPLQYDLNMGSIQGASAGAASAQTRDLQEQMSRTAGEWRQKGQDAAQQFQQPLIERRRAQLESQLANMGLTRGSEAWNNELQRDSDQATRDQLQSFGAGQSEASMLFNQDLQAGQFTNSARMQRFQQDATNAGFQQQSNMANAQFAQQAAMQNSQNKLLEAQFRNQAAGQQFNQGLQGAGFMNNAQNQDFQQQMQAAGLANNVNQQQFSQNLASGQFANSAQQQQFGQNQAQASLFNQAQGQNYAQDMGQANLYNQAQQQRFGQNQAAAQFGNQAQQQQFAQNAANTQMFNSGQQQNFDNLARQAQMGDQQAQAQLQMQMQAGQYNQQIRQQQLAEQLSQRSQPLNELNALLTGQQIGMPTMPTFNTAGRAETTQYSNAAQQQNQASMDAFNAKQQATTGALQGAASMAMMFSDKRLKSDIKPLFSLGGEAEGIKLYSFNFKPTGERKVGVLAQEVQKVMPDAVAKDPETGYLKVNYNKVFS